jgi:mannose-6-phosphate isomerase-like protein (cupin superfamily)
MEASTTTHIDRPRFDASQGPRKLGPNDGEYVDLGGIGVRFMTYMEETGGGFSLVEHPIEPHALCAPLHMHTREDEYSYVIEGKMGAILGDDVVYAEAGDFVFKPREQWHTFWNDGDEPCRILEIIAPGGFEHYFDELGDLVAAEEPDLDAMMELNARYGIEMRPETVPEICAKYGLWHPMLEMVAG